MNTFSFIPQLFDARFHGCYSFSSVLEYHNSIETMMPQDGLTWLCEHPDMKKLLSRKNNLVISISELVNGMKDQTYGVWTILDKEAHILRCRLQLVDLCIQELQKSKTN